MTTLVYLHGFMGSSRSNKARQTVEWFSEHYPTQPIWVPDLPHQPAAAIELVSEYLQSAGDAVFIGSSLGGFYANQFSEMTGARAVMINPSVYPHRTIGEYLGPQQSPYTGEKFTVTEESIGQLRELYVESMSDPALRMVLLQTGDETLNYREAESYYRGSHCTVEQGGDHSFVDYPRYLPAIARFLLED